MTRRVIDRQSPERSPGPGCIPAVGVGILLGIVAGVTFAMMVDSMLWPIVAGVVIAMAAALALRFGRGRGGRA